MFRLLQRIYTLFSTRPDRTLKFAFSTRWNSALLNDCHDSTINNFAEIARGFCASCENTSVSDIQAASWLCQLYAAALTLPEVEAENAGDLPDLPPDLLERAKKHLAGFNGRYYREYFNPDSSLNDESVMGDIADDLLDTYKDIRTGLLLFDRGDTTEALWQWTFLHRTHWGRHAVGAIFALHCLSIGA